MNEIITSDFPDRAAADKDKKVQRTCFSHLWSFFCSSTFLITGIGFAIALALLGATRSYGLASGFAFIYAFFWQRRATRQGCFMPVFIFMAFFTWQLLVVGALVYNTGLYRQIDFVQLRNDLKREAPELYEFGEKIVKNLGIDVQGMMTNVVDAARNAVAEFTRDPEEKRLIELEHAFQENPGSVSAVMALAEAYAARSDLASVKLAAALYEALVEVEPSDTCLAALADCYARLLRPDMAFAAAARRAWLPQAPLDRVARQIALLAITAGDLPRGIFELEKLLLLPTAETPAIKLLLAGLNHDSGNDARALALLHEIIAEVPAGFVTAQQAAKLQQIWQAN